MGVVALLVAWVIVLWFYILWTRRRYYALIWKIPGPPGLPLIGSIHKLYNLAETLYVIQRYTIKYKSKMILVWLGPWPVLHITDPKIVEIFLNSSNCITKSFLYDAFIDLMGDGLVMSKPPRWNKHRKLLNPSFRYNVLLSLFSTFNKLADNLCDRIEERLDSKKIDVRRLLFDVTLETAIVTTTGLDTNKELVQTITHCYEKMLAMTVDKIMNPFLRIDTLYQKTKLYKSFMEYRNTICNIIQDHAMKKIKHLNRMRQSEDVSIMGDQFEDEIKKPKNILIDNAIDIYFRNDFTFEDIITESGMMLFAAYETTATSLFAIIMCLAMHPQYQNRVVDEIHSAFPDNDFDIKYEDFKNLVFLDMCINETLRLIPPIPLIGRSCTGEVKLSDDLVIPKGTEIVIDIFNMHRDKDIWGPNAHVFNPDNFLPANLVDKHKYAYIPFSKGPRNCIGWQYSGMFLKVMLVKILSKYKFSTNFKFEDLRFAEHISLKLIEIPHLEVQRR